MWPYFIEKTQKNKLCPVRSTRHALIGCSKCTEHATLRVLLTRLDESVFGSTRAYSPRLERIRLDSGLLGLAGSVGMRSNYDNFFDHLGIFCIKFFDRTPICSTLESLDIRDSTE